MKAGFAEIDITPRVGVQLCGFGPFLNRYSIGVRDRLKARAAAFELGDEKALIISCDLIGITADIASKVKNDIASACSVQPESIILQCTHTHSGPNTAGYKGWGEEDQLYTEMLPARIVKAALSALEKLDTVEVFYAETPCEGMGLNREYDIDAPPLEDVLDESWRPAKPELTDTSCHVLKFMSEADGRIAGFMTYFGCHPVVCCKETRYIHGDYCGVALNKLESENAGAVGLFLQGAQGDVNSCVVHKPEKESLEALDIIAERFAKAVRKGLNDSEKIPVDELKSDSAVFRFSVKPVPIQKLKEMLAEREAVVRADGASDEDGACRMAMVGILAIRRLISQMEKGEDMRPAGEMQGIKMGPVEFLAAPFEIMQAIKNDVKARTEAEIPLVMGISNGSLGYAPDKTVAARGGYAADVVPIITGQLPYSNIHEELVAAFLEIDKNLND